MHSGCSMMRALRRREGLGVHDNAHTAQKRGAQDDSAVPTPMKQEVRAWDVEAEIAADAGRVRSAASTVQFSYIGKSRLGPFCVGGLAPESRWKNATALKIGCTFPILQGGHCLPHQLTALSQRSSQLALVALRVLNLFLWTRRIFAMSY
jgi:hypothetical protein